MRMRMLLLNWLIYFFLCENIDFIETNMGLRDFHISLNVCPFFIVPLRFFEVHDK